MSSGGLPVIGGSGGIPIVGTVNGVAVTGTPSVGQVPTATSSSAASWQTQTATSVNAVPRPNTRRWAYMCSSGQTFTSSGNFSIGDYLQESANSQSASLGSSTLPASNTLTTAASSGQVAGFFGNAIYWLGRNIRFEIYCAQSSISGSGRFWVGVNASSPLATDTPTTIKLACFRASETASDTDFQCVTSSGSAETITSSGVAINTAFHKFEIVFNDTTPNVTFYIDGNLVATNSTNLPGSSGTALYWQVGIAATASTARSFSWAWTYVESDF
jgi:hypothetical protein